MNQTLSPLTIVPAAVLDVSRIVPEPLVPRVVPGWRGRLGAWAADGAGALLGNLLVVLLLVRFAFPAVGEAKTPHAVSVDLVTDAEAAAAGSDPSKGAAGKPGGTAETATTKPDPAPASPPGETDASSQKPPETKLSGAEPPQPKPPEPTPAPAPAAPPPAEAQAGPPPTPPPAPKAEVPAAVPPPPPQPSAVPSLALQPPAAAAPVPSATTPVPPPIEAASGLSAQPQLIAVPPPPGAAKTQTEKSVAGNAAPDQTGNASTPPASSGQAAPPLISTQSDAADTVPEAAVSTDAPKLTEAERKKQDENTAKLAAVLPFARTIEPSDARAAAAGEGQSGGDTYRGAVYGAFRKSDDLVEAAREKHLKGQAVVNFSIDGNGAITSIHIAMSSGNPEVDATALGIIQHAAPFPPPPPGAPRTFSPAIGLGLDDGGQ